MIKKFKDYINESMDEELDEEDIIRKINNLDIPENIKREINDMIAGMLADDDPNNIELLYREIISLLKSENISIEELEEDLKDIMTW